MASTKTLFKQQDFTVSVEADVKAARRVFKEIGEKRVNMAASNALNVVGRRVKKLSIGEVAERRAIGKRNVGKAMTFSRSSRINLRATVTTFGKPISLKHYGFRVTKKAGATVKIGRTRKSVNEPNVFVAAAATHQAGDAFGPLTPAAFNKRTLGGHVFSRIGKARNAIRKLMGPSLPTAFLSAVVRIHQDRLIAKDWRPVFRQKLADQLRKVRDK